MKNILSNLSTKSLALLLLILPAMTSCDKCKDNVKPMIKEQMVGDWKIKSLTIDGVETIGSVITLSKMEFEKYSGVNGDFEWQISYSDGTSEIQSGDYTVDEEDKEVEFENNEGERLKFDVDLDGNDLELSGIIDGERYVIKSERD